MKKILVIIAFLALNICNSQNISGYVLDSISQKPLELASIFSSGNDLTVFTDADGKFKTKIPDAKSRLFISYIGYEGKCVNLRNVESRENEFRIFLKPKPEQLPEVVVERRNAKYGGQKKIEPATQRNTQFFSFQFGTENCTYVSNPYGNRGKIQSVTLDLKKEVNGTKDCPKCEIDYLTAYSVRFYSYDSITKMPGNELYDKNIIVTPENKSYHFRINVDSLLIPFPENGVCVGIEYLNTKYVNPKRAGAFIAPAMNFSESRNFHPVLAWRRYRNEGWKFTTVIASDRKEKKYDFMIVDLAVKIRK